MVQIYVFLVTDERKKPTFINSLLIVKEINLTAVSSQLTGFATTVSALQEALLTFKTPLMIFPTTPRR